MFFSPFLLFLSFLLFLFFIHPGSNVYPMRLVVKWIIQPICRSLLTCCEWSSFLRVSSLVSFSFFLFVAVGSSHALTYYCRCLRSARDDHTIYDKRWVTADQGGLGGYFGDCAVYPQLASLSHASGGGSSVQYWQPGFTASTAPYLYTVVPFSSLDFTVDEAYTNHFESSLASLTPSERSSINRLASQVNGDRYDLLMGHYREGTRVGNAVAGFDSSGHPVLCYPDSTGYVPSYSEAPQGGFVPVWYDITTTSGQAIRLNSLQNVASDSLQYDPDTGLYSFSLPDYSAQLASIDQSLSTIANRDVSFNPEIVVNPEVTVTPDVTVNVSAPTQNDITVAIDNSELIAHIDDVAATINDDQWTLNIVEQCMERHLESINDTVTDTESVNDFDLSSAQLSQEEQSLLNLPQQWNTQIPLIGNAANVAFGAFLGNIPDPGRSLVPLNLNLLGFNLTIDFTPYSTFIAWFRAFVLMCEFIWFVDCIWRTVVKALTV